jgi:hypothetical protein
VTDSTIQGNQAASDSGFGGGGISTGGIGTLTLTRVTLSGNTVTGTGDGGGLFITSTTNTTTNATLTNVTFATNQAGGSGGGIALLSRNSPSAEAFATLTHVTIGTDNTATVSGNGLFLNEALGTAVLTTQNTIYGAACGSAGAPGVTDNGGNMRTTGNSCPGANASVNGLQLAALGDNGGFTQTLAIPGTSDAHDSTSTCPTTTDQRGLPRNLGGANCDAGAFELRASGNAPPVISAIPDLAFYEDTTSGPIPLRVAESNAALGSNTLTVSVATNNSPAVPNGGFGFASSTCTSCSVLLTPTANLNGNGTATIQVTSATGTATSAPFAVNVLPVNDGPSVTLGANPSSNEDAGPQSVPGFATNLSPGPTGTTNENGQTVTGFTVTVTGTTGTLAFTTAPAIDTSTGVLIYQTAANTNGSAMVTVTLSDDGGTADGGVNTSSQQFTIAVNPVNDPPEFTLAGNPPAVSEDAGPQTVTGFATGLQPGPVGVADEAAQTLTGFTVTVTGTTGSLAFTTAPAIDLATGTLTYTPSAGSSGTATVSVTLADNGGTANGGADTSSPQQFTITVTGVNNPPVNTVPAAQTTPGNTPKVFSSANGNAISIADADAGTGNLQMTLTVTSGTLALGSTAGLTVTGNNSAAVTATGTLASLNAGLQGLTFTPANTFEGVVTLTITTNDQGSTGAGGPKSDSDTVLIGVGTVPFVSVNDPAAVAEGDSGAPNSLVFTVSLSAPSNLPIAVPYSTSNGPTPGGATGGTSCGAAGADYQTTTGTATIPAGATSATVSVPICGDTLAEGAETLRLDLGTTTNAIVLDGQGVGTITDDDQAGTLSFGAATAQVSEGAGSVTLTVQRSGVDPAGAARGQRAGPSAIAAIDVGFSTSNGTAIAGSDYTATTGTLTFGVGETTKTVTIPLVADEVIEPNETFSVTLSGPTGGAILGATATATVTIVDDDQAGAVAFGGAAATVSEGVGTASLIVQRSTGLANGLTVQYSTADGSAKAGSDYARTAGTLTFAAGETTKTISVPILTDQDAEGDEMFTVTLANVSSGATLGSPSTVTVTIQDASPAANISPGEDDTDKPRKQTAEQRQQRERTNNGNKDDVYTEGNVVEVHLDPPQAYIVIGMKDGPQRVDLLCGSACPTIVVGDYVQADGEKEDEGLFHATDVTVTRAR